MRRDLPPGGPRVGSLVKHFKNNDTFTICPGTGLKEVSKEAENIRAYEFGNGLR